MSWPITTRARMVSTRPRAIARPMRLPENLPVGRGRRHPGRAVIERFPGPARLGLDLHDRVDLPDGAAGLADEAVEDREKERRRLAAAGHRAGEHVTAGEGGRDSIGLNRRRAGEAEVLESGEKAGMKLQRGKWHRLILSMNE